MDREALENRIRQHHQAGDLTKAATEAIDGYGAEILSYLLAVLRDESLASDVFAITCESLWATLKDFRWECSFRTWAYTLARRSASRLQRDPQLKLGHRVPLSRSPEVWDMAERVRTATLPYLRTETKDRFARLREKLHPDEQALLILRVNREMSWKEIAQILSPDDAGDEPEELQRQAGTLRKRFQRVKENLRELARADGIDL